VSSPLNFLFVTTDSQTRSGDRAPASRVADFRLQIGEWPLYKNTRNKKSLQPGHRVLIYLGGRSATAGVVIATATVQDIRAVRSPRDSREVAEFLTDYPSSIMRLTDVMRLPATVQLRRVVPQLECCPKNMQKWGIILHGGVRQLSDYDYDFIVKESKKLVARTASEGASQTIATKKQRATDM
jgi:hypothetical protein